MLTLESREHYDQRHGGCFDRGSADSYYGRGRRPHFFTDATYQSREITEQFMTQAQIAAYHAGYDYNEQFGDKKNWY
jgi:hypothetical protein